jgi:hypothetical protein
MVPKAVSSASAVVVGCGRNKTPAHYSGAAVVIRAVCCDEQCWAEEQTVCLGVCAHAWFRLLCHVSHPHELGYKLDALAQRDRDGARHTNYLLNPGRFIASTRDEC